ncbi:hypothetical protein KM043_015584 [Ampulex compressa]|nr:hypothetical protein KM043_015584 [Ampulex compressa]
MTYKHVMALKWTTYHCPSAKYILKLDDDVFVHMPAMLDFLTRDLSPWGARRLILCDLLLAGTVKRSWRSKWRVSPQEYPGRQYPAYCPGWAVLYSPDAVFLLYREAQKEPYFWIDDVHVTGTLARKCRNIGEKKQNERAAMVNLITEHNEYTYPLEIASIYSDVQEECFPPRDITQSNCNPSLQEQTRVIKMSMQQFCLRWNNHQPNFISVFSNLLNNETLVDVTLAAEGRHLQAHKVVLSACSTYFQSLFTVNPCQHPIVILKDVKFSDLKIMVDFMYYGEVNISQDQLPSIIKTAESLKIKGLAEMHTASLTKWPSGSSEPGGGDRGESCSPSPSPLSPSFRRKRLRKSSTGSTSGSGDKPEEINEITLVATNIVKPEPLIVSQETGENLRRPVNTSTESQGSIDEDQISIMSNMENSSATTPAQSDGSIQDVSQQSGGNVGQSSVSSQPPSHQGLQWTIMEHTYPRFALSSCQTNLSIQASSAFTTPEITASSTISDQYSGTSTTGSSCALTNYPNSSHGTLQHASSSGPSASAQCPSNCQSPCASPQTAIKRKRSTNPQADENFIRALDAVRYGGIGFCKAARMFGVNNRTLWLEYKKRGYPNNRPSLKSRVKQEVNSSPPPAPPAQPVNSQSPTPMGPPSTPHSTHNTHSTHTMLTTHSPHTMLSGYIDSRHTDYALPSTTMPINLHGVNYNAM